MDSLPKEKITSFRGDGMDSTLISTLENPLQNSDPLKFNYRSSQAILKSLKPVQPSNVIINPIPKYVPSKRKTAFLIGKSKEPKFVPYEPYKAAVEPIIPHKRIIQHSIASSKNNVDLNDLVTQLSDVRVAELNKSNVNVLENHHSVISRQEWEKEKKAFEIDIKNLRETNSHLENQLKFQTQVNRELKTLLVASVGEDLESRVQHLTEDKLQLARALLNSTDHLTSHQEKTEWLSGQCEVWRSKFLASSVMVEELARWKSALSNRINELHEIIKNLMHERNRVRGYSLKTYSCLVNLLRYLKVPDELVSPLKSTNILELSVMNSSLCAEAANRLIKEGDLCKMDVGDIDSLPRNTYAEQQALQMSQAPVSLLNKPDLICKALVGAAMSITGGQMYLQHPDLHATCCTHCKGNIENI